MINALQEKAAQGAKRAAWATAGTVLLCVGVAFLTAAAWMVLSTLQDALFAALVIGFIYTGLGGIVPPKKAQRLLRPLPARTTRLSGWQLHFLQGFNLRKTIVVKPNFE